MIFMRVLIVNTINDPQLKEYLIARLLDIMRAPQKGIWQGYKGPEYVYAKKIQVWAALKILTSGVIILSSQFLNIWLCSSWTVMDGYILKYNSSKL